MTNLYGSNAKTAGLEDKADAAGGDTFTQAADYSSSHQHVLHFATKN